MELQETPCPADVFEYSLIEAPYIYTKYGQEIAEKNGCFHRKAGSIVFFGLYPLKKCSIAETWIKKGYIKERKS